MLRSVIQSEILSYLIRRDVGVNKITLSGGLGVMLWTKLLLDSAQSIVISQKSESRSQKWVKETEAWFILSLFLFAIKTITIMKGG